jgi:hypothetical protein
LAPKREVIYVVIGVWVGVVKRINVADADGVFQVDWNLVHLINHVAVEVLGEAVEATLGVLRLGWRRSEQESDRQ